MTPEEIADKILRELNEEFLVGGQLRLWLHKKITEAIEAAVKEATTKKGGSSYAKGNSSR